MLSVQYMFLKQSLNKKQHMMNYAGLDINTGPQPVFWCVGQWTWKITGPQGQCYYHLSDENTSIDIVQPIVFCF